MTTLYDDDYYWAEKYDWRNTMEPHIWFCKQTSLFHFSDETSQFDRVGYDSIEKCKNALDHYCEKYL